jgi:hypothetical protein
MQNNAINFVRRSTLSRRASLLRGVNNSKTYGGTSSNARVNINNMTMISKRQISVLAVTSNYLNTQKVASTATAKRLITLKVSPTGGWEEDNLCCGEQDEDGT